MTENKAYSFPPRVWVDTGTLDRGDYPLAKFGSGRCIGDEQYLSLEEHTALLAQAKAEAFEAAADILNGEDPYAAEQIMREKAKQIEEG